MSMKYGGDNVTFPDNSIQSTAAAGFGFKNRIINGAMMIDQRNAGASVTPATGGSTSSYTLDRWMLNTNISSAASIQQNAGSVTPPAGFANYLGVTSLAATSVGASSYSLLEHRVEGFNFADMAWGTASANPITISFWVRSSLTGTFGGCLQTSATRFYAYTFTINAANTWEQKTITIAGDTSGTPATGNTTALYVRWSIACGSTYRQATGSWSGTAALGATGQTDVLATNGATFYITGVQLEKGSTATSFDYRPYGTELALCQRYFQNIVAGYNGSAVSGTANGTMGQFIVPLRAVPTMTWISNIAAINFPTTTASFYLSSTVQNFWPYKTASATGQDSRYHDNYTASAEL